MFIELQKVQKRSLYEMIADELEKEILGNKERYGEKLPPEHQLANHFDVSRNVIREAFKVLKERGLIDIINGDGAYVARPGSEQLKSMLTRIITMNQSDIVNMFEIRCALETTAAGLAAARITNEGKIKLERLLSQIRSTELNVNDWATLDTEFHTLIVRQAQNNMLFNIYQPFLSSLQEVSEKNLQKQGSMEHGITDHIGIAEYILCGDSKQAAKLMEKHINLSKADLLSVLETGAG